MTEAGTPLSIKRYAGTRLYDPAAGAYLTLDDLSDITGSVLKQIIVERRRHG
jgi:polyhydroxyalkanoate synthesis regulator protein